MSIINDTELKADTVQTIAEQLEIEQSIAEQLINDNELEECSDLMYDTQGEYIESLLPQLQKRLSVYYIATEEQ